MTRYQDGAQSEKPSRGALPKSLQKVGVKAAGLEIRMGQDAPVEGRRGVDALDREILQRLSHARQGR